MVSGDVLTGCFCEADFWGKEGGGIAIAHLMKVMALTRKMCVFTFHGGQFIGLLESFGPSQSTMLGSMVSSDFCSWSLFDAEKLLRTLASRSAGFAVSSSVPSLWLLSFVFSLGSLSAVRSLSSWDFFGDMGTLSVEAVSSLKAVTGALKDFGSPICRQLE